MQLIGSVLLIAINLYTIVLWARLILDWALVLVPAFRPKGAVLVLAELVFSLTDPPLKLVRRFVKPLRVGSIALDLAWIVVIVALNLVAILIRSTLL